MALARSAGPPQHADGLLELAFRVGPGDRTVLASRRQRFPLRLTVPLMLDPALPGMAFVYVQNPTGGVFAGDRLRRSHRRGARDARAPDDALGDQGVPDGRGPRRAGARADAWATARTWSRFPSP